MKTQQKIAIIGAASFLVAGFVFSKIYINKNSREELLEIAEELALLWKNRLELDLYQTSKMEDLIIEFTLKKNAIINSKTLSEDEIIYRLKSIQKAEHKKLKSFMSEPQFVKYLELNKKISQEV
ncbi:hypothetical protein SAMN05444483_101700 [Salegentibacter echinorum]|uniref:Uncharacterized protein n=1 Tax=Salegentibacter echinorum TaxID=1073325 RepID=A0A1M5CWH9_SALEC|nr:hypothetical protein [Salegentibacter echinorum]SHF59046.1 hypothetical protein SAMN05444483_101700 [Salegentibacter echinorum]